MNWKKRYSKITSTSQLKVGDFISWRGDGHRRYALLTRVEVNGIWGRFNDSRTEALNNPRAEPEKNLGPISVNLDIQLEEK